MSSIRRHFCPMLLADRESAFCVHFRNESKSGKTLNLFFSIHNEILFIKSTYLVILRRSRKLGEPRRLGIDGDLDVRLIDKKMSQIGFERMLHAAKAEPI